MFPGKIGTNAATSVHAAAQQEPTEHTHLNINGVKILASADKMPSKGNIGLHFEESTPILTVKLYTSSTFDTVETFEIRDDDLFTTMKQAVDSGNIDGVKAALLSIRHAYPSMPQFVLSEDNGTQFKITLSTLSAASSKLAEIKSLISPLTPSTTDLKVRLNDISYKISYFMRDHGLSCSESEKAALKQYKDTYIRLGGDPVALMHVFYTR